MPNPAWERQAAKPVTVKVAERATLMDRVRDWFARVDALLAEVHERDVT